jgi:hypothetical protein
MQKPGVLSFPFLCDLCETEPSALGCGVLSHSVEVRIILSFFMLSVIPCHLVRQSCPFFDVASPILFCLFVVCLCFSFSRHPRYSILSLPLLLLCVTSSTCFSGCCWGIFWAPECRHRRTYYVGRLLRFDAEPEATKLLAHERSGLGIQTHSIRPDTIIVLLCRTESFKFQLSGFLSHRVSGICH